jgi:hypothetical protein
MDWIKVSMDRVFGFLTAVIPGTAAFVVLGLHHPDWVKDFRDGNYLGYRTKVWLVVAVAFALGWSLTIIFLSVLEVIKWRIYRNWPNQEWDNLRSNPWQQTHWRALVTAVYGKGAPEIVPFLRDDTVAFQIERANLLAEPERSRVTGEVRYNKLKGDINDGEWKSWWRDLHTAQVTQPRDPVLRMVYALADNICTACLFILIAAPFTPALWHWWLIALCLFWVIQLIARIRHNFSVYADPWASYLQQMSHLREQLESSKELV